MQSVRAGRCESRHDDKGKRARASSMLQSISLSLIYERPIANAVAIAVRIRVGGICASDVSTPNVVSMRS
jgi:hypothetical protein